MEGWTAQSRYSEYQPTYAADNFSRRAASRFDDVDAGRQSRTSSRIGQSNLAGRFLDGDVFTREEPLRIVTDWLTCL